MKRWMSLLLCTVLASTITTQAGAVTELDDVVVVATRVATPVSQVGSSVTVIDREMIERLQQPNVLDLLRTVPGVDVVRSGGLGQKTSVFMRGANSEHTLVLIDGIEANDPNDPSRAFDFAHLPSENIERIEVLRGPQSTLYGSDAMGGVINVITRKGRDGSEIEFQAEAGSFQTQRYQAALRGTASRLNYSMHASYLDSDGTTAALRELGNREKDGYEKIALSTRIGVEALENVQIDFIARYLEGDTDLDIWSWTTGNLVDDPNYTFDNEQLFTRVQLTADLFESWEQILGVSYAKHNRGTHNTADLANPFSTERTTYDGTLTKVDWQNNLKLAPWQTLTLGCEYEEETGESLVDYGYGAYEFKKKSVTTFGGYIQDQLIVGERLSATVGVRLDDHERFGQETTWRTTVSYHHKETATHLRGSYGTGFKSPSLSQLYDTQWGGNENLDPEYSRGWDVGVEQNLFLGKIVLGLTYFNNDFKDLIATEVVSFVPYKSIYVNVGEAETCGVEATFIYTPFDNLSIHANYTYLDAENKDSGDRLLRRARDRFAVDLYYQILAQADLSIEYQYVGEREDYSSLGTIDLSSYSVVNVALGYDINESVRLFGRVDNLLDKDYVETWGYETPSLAINVGIRCQL